MSYQDEVLKELKTQSSLLAALAKQMSLAAQASRPLPYRRKLAEFARFDWSAIGAVVIDTDAHGVAEVEWIGHRYIRRSAGGKFGEAIWYSRALTDAESYEVLIKFADYAAEPLQVEPPAGAPPPAAPRPATPPTPPATPAPKSQIDPLDIQQTARPPKPTKPTNLPPVAASQPDQPTIETHPGKDPKFLFYEISSKAINAGYIKFDQINALVSEANRTSFAEALQKLVILVQPHAQVTTAA